MSLLACPRANKNSLINAQYKTTPEDFYVEELMDIEFSGEGEHLYLYIEKIGQNTEYVAKQLAKSFGLQQMDVGFSGLKDRWAVTRQWFSLYVRKQQFDAIDLSSIEGVQLIDQARHNKKLRRGEHKGNHFKLVIRGLSSIDSVEDALEAIRDRGFPNYFGVQRFGREGQNLERAKRWFAGEIKVSRSQRSFYLSAARSYLFNVLLAQRVDDKCWQDGDGPLYGDDTEGVEPMSDAERVFFDQYPELVSGLHKNRMTLARRPYKMPAQNLAWAIKADTLTLSFDLAPGAFATSLLAEIFVLEDVSSQNNEMR